MKRVTGIGGIFFKAKDAPTLQAWYKRHLGIDVQAWGGAAFTWTDADPESAPDFEGFADYDAIEIGTGIAIEF